MVIESSATTIVSDSGKTELTAFEDSRSGGSSESRQPCPAGCRDVNEVDLLEQVGVPFVVRVDRAERLLVGAARGVRVAGRLVSAAECEGSEAERGVEIEDVPQRLGCGERLTAFELDDRLQKAALGVERDRAPVRSRKPERLAETERRRVVRSAAGQESI